MINTILWWYNHILWNQGTDIIIRLIKNTPAVWLQAWFTCILATGNLSPAMWHLPVNCQLHPSCLLGNTLTANMLRSNSRNIALGNGHLIGNKMWIQRIKDMSAAVGQTVFWPKWPALPGDPRLLILESPGIAFAVSKNSRCWPKICSFFLITKWSEPFQTFDVLDGTIDILGFHWQKKSFPQNPGIIILFEFDRDPLLQTDSSWGILTFQTKVRRRKVDRWILPEYQYLYTMPFSAI